MNAARTLEMVRSTGFTISVVGGRMFLRGKGKVPTPLVESIQVHKSEIMTLIQQAAAKEANKAKEVRSEDLMDEFVGLPLPATMPRFTPEGRQDLLDQVMRQGKPATGWCMVRASAYFEKFPDSGFLDQEVAAAADFLRWQDATGHEGMAA